MLLGFEKVIGVPIASLEHITCVAGAAVTVGLGKTVTKTEKVVVEHPPVVAVTL